MLEHKVLYTSDMHGNKSQFETFLDYAIKIKVATIIIGGDLAPKNSFIDPRNSRYIDSQRKFLENDLPELIKYLKKGSPNTNVFLMLGNDDCIVNLDVLNAHPHLYQEIHEKRFRIDDNHEIVGYSFVPITPFGIKDHEKFDLSEAPEWAKKDYEERKRTSYRLDGAKSVKKSNFGWELYQFDGNQETSDSIQKDLLTETFTKQPQNTVYVFHSPPNNTALDVIQNGTHVGSFAVREFIQKNKPKLTLHGHIHETVDMSGSFIDNIGDTALFSAGNHDYDSKVAVVEFDLYNLKSAQRKKLLC